MTSSNLIRRFLYLFLLLSCLYLGLTLDETFSFIYDSTVIAIDDIVNNLYYRGNYEIDIQKSHKNDVRKSFKRKGCIRSNKQ